MPGHAISVGQSRVKTAGRGARPFRLTPRTTAGQSSGFCSATPRRWSGRDLVGRAFPDEEAARAYGETVVQAQGGIEFAVMCRRADRPGWMEVGTGQNAHQVLARQWSERIAGRFAAGALH